MIATDGTAFTGAVTVYVTLDLGVQAIGTVGGGACTHEGNGLHTYAPSQAETNGDLCEFTFVGSGAIPVTVHIYTNFPQTGDNYVRVGAPVGASLSADVAAVKAQIVTINADTDDIQSRLPAALTGGGNIKADVQVNSDKTGYAIGAGGIANTAFAAGAIDASAIAADAIGSSELAASAVTEIQTAILSDATPFAGASVAAIKAKTDNLPEGFKKNTAFSAFMFYMVDSLDHVTPKTGLSPSATRSIDGGALAATANSPVEVGSGFYKIDLAAADLNGSIVSLKFTGVGADTTALTLKTTL